MAVPNPESMAAHRNGKKHFAKVQLLKKEKQRRCGIFVRGYPVPPNQQQLLALFNRFGKVTSYVFQNSYLLLEYENEESVAILMRRPRYFQNRRLTINHRTPSGSTEGNLRKGVSIFCYFFVFFTVICRVTIIPC